MPQLNLDQYALLRAYLVVRGERHQGTWAEFGIGSSEVMEALTARFAARFRADPAAQYRFVELVRKLTENARREGR